MICAIQFILYYTIQYALSENRTERIMFTNSYYYQYINNIIIIINYYAIYMVITH